MLIRTWEVLVAEVWQICMVAILQLVLDTKEVWLTKMASKLTTKGITQTLIESFNSSRLDRYLVQIINHRNLARLKNYKLGPFHRMVEVWLNR